MKAPFNAEQQKRRLRRLLLLFCLLFTLPVYFLLQTLYGKLEAEAYFTARHQAEQLLDNVEQRLHELLLVEQQRPSAEYSFFNVLESPLLDSSAIQFSPLSQHPPQTNISGMVGYFQINPDGSFHLPALPELGQDNESGLSLAELESRLALKRRLQSLLAKQQAEALDESISADKTGQPTVVDQDDQYIVGQANDSFYREQENRPEKEKAVRFAPLSRQLSSKKDVRKKALNQSYQIRKEQVQLPDQAMAGSLFKRKQAAAPGYEAESSRQEAKAEQDIGNTIQSSVATDSINISRFESEVTPLQSLLINRDYICFYRYVWHDNNRYTQGFVVAIRALFDAVITPLVGQINIANLQLKYRGKMLQRFYFHDQAEDNLLYSRTLPSPLSQLQWDVYSTELKPGAGRRMIDVLAASIAIIIVLGMIVLYRLLSHQIELARQQQNFISAVSHELKTPLTSIRMYGEMLRSGWVEGESKKQQYYDFIFFESERLSRLIANILQLARINHGNHNIELNVISPRQLLTRVSGKVAVQQQASAFAINMIEPDPSADDIEIKVDEDAFFQIIINLVDNAIKFAAEAECKQIDIGVKQSEPGKQVVFFVRDYGPGIPKQQLKKIFRLFYRPGNELTRAAPGTGIGLALVTQLAEAMNAQVSAVNRQPGVEFQIRFSSQNSAK